MKTHLTLSGLFLAVTIALPAHAALQDRGGGLLYDDVLNVTWLQDANYAKTSSYDADGLMNWSAAKTWANNLVYHDSVRNVDLTGWRLASNAPVGADWNYNYSFNGTTDFSYNISSKSSELSYMYYVNLGLKSIVNTSGVFQPDYGVFGNGTYGGQKNVGPVKNLQSWVYWSGTAFAPNPASVAWSFDSIYGEQYGRYQTDEVYAWAVRPGDVAAVPEPEAYALLMAGLGLLGLTRLKRKST